MHIEDPEAPEWFTKALAAPVEYGRFNVPGITIAYRAWGPVGAPGLVLVHGGMAHSGWWDHIGPLLATERRVVALDLSGHGDSEAREQYSLEDFGEEILAAANAGGIAGKPIVVGHSMGGIVAYGLASSRPDRLGGVIILDSPIRELTPEEREMRARFVPKPPRVYSDIDDAVDRFRLVPPQEHAEPYIRDHVARESLRRVEGGWSWKFDPRRMGRSRERNFLDTRAGTRVAYFRSEHGIITDELLDAMRPMFGDDALVVELADAGHHPMFDQPLAVVAGIRTVLEVWSR